MTNTPIAGPSHIHWSTTPRAAYRRQRATACFSSSFNSGLGIRVGDEEDRNVSPVAGAHMRRSMGTLNASIGAFNASMDTLFLPMDRSIHGMDASFQLMDAHGVTMDTHIGSMDAYIGTMDTHF